MRHHNTKNRKKGKRIIIKYIPWIYVNAQLSCLTGFGHKKRWTWLTQCQEFWALEENGTCKLPVPSVWGQEGGHPGLQTIMAAERPPRALPLLGCLLVSDLHTLFGKLLHPDFIYFYFNYINLFFLIMFCVKPNRWFFVGEVQWIMETHVHLVGEYQAHAFQGKDRWRLSVPPLKDPSHHLLIACLLASETHPKVGSWGWQVCPDSSLCFRIHTGYSRCSW